MCWREDNFEFRTICTYKIHFRMRIKTFSDNKNWVYYQKTLLYGYYFYIPLCNNTNGFKWHMFVISQFLCVRNSEAAELGGPSSRSLRRLQLGRWPRLHSSWPGSAFFPGGSFKVLAGGDKWPWFLSQDWLITSGHGSWLPHRVSRSKKKQGNNAMYFMT